MVQVSFYYAISSIKIQISIASSCGRCNWLFLSAKELLIHFSSLYEHLTLAARESNCDQGERSQNHFYKSLRFTG